MDRPDVLDKLINPWLYQLLKAAYPSTEVRHAGQAMNCRYDRRLGVDGKERKSLVVAPGGNGEHYVLNCPRCGDTRKRLSINHRWRVKDNQSNSRNLWLMNCYNESCFSSYAQQSAFYEELKILARSGRADVRVADLRPGKLAASQGLLPPGAIWSLVDMQQRSPDHPALQYLRSRLVDPISLAYEYGVCYCADSSFSHTVNRLILPITWRGRQVGWQARCLGEPSSREVPKYKSGPGSNFDHGFNLERAAGHFTKVIVEGFFDVVGVGEYAWAILNKSLSTGKLRNLWDEVQQYDDVGTFVVLLDAKQNPKEAAKGLEHPIEKAYAQLCEVVDPCRVAKVYLPESIDPGSLFPGVAWDFIEHVAAKQGVPVDRSLLSRRT